MPSQHQRGSPAFQKFRVDAREASGPTTRNELFTMLQGVRRAAHSSTPDSGIRDVAIASRRKLDEADLERVPSMLPTGAMPFWRP